MQVFELKIPPVALGAIFAVAMWAAAEFFSAASLNFPGTAYLAFAFALLGSGIAIAGVVAFRRHGTTVNPMKPEMTATVVTSGIYRVTRNPMYLGLAFVLLGWAIHLTNPVALLLVAAFTAYMTRFQIKPEERALLAKFGSSFADYMIAVRRWI